MERLPGLKFEFPRASDSATLPNLIEDQDILSAPEWKVIVFNNDTNTYEEVITILMIATHCDSEEAYVEAWEVDHYGQCAVHFAEKEECDFVAKVISKIGIRVEVHQDSL